MWNKLTVEYLSNFPPGLSHHHLAVSSSGNPATRFLRHLGSFQRYRPQLPHSSHVEINPTTTLRQFRLKVTPEMSYCRHWSSALNEQSCLSERWTLGRSLCTFGSIAVDWSLCIQPPSQLISHPGEWYCLMLSRGTVWAHTGLMSCRGDVFINWTIDLHHTSVNCMIMPAWVIFSRVDFYLTAEILMRKTSS